VRERWAGAWIPAVCPPGLACFFFFFFTAAFIVFMPVLIYERNGKGRNSIRTQMPDT